MRRLVLLVVALFLLGTLIGSVPAYAEDPSIDFETPSLGREERRIINPYVDEAAGVTFTAEGSEADAVVGLVKNSATSACVEPSDSNQKLGTGRSNTPDGNIGRGSYVIRATFRRPLDGPIAVSVTFQTKAGVLVRLRLFDANNGLLTTVSEPALPADGTCGMPGDPRARKTLTASTNAQVAYAIMDLEQDTGRYVFVIDDFRFQLGSSSISSTYTRTPPSIDGVIGFGEWNITNQMTFPHGFVTVLNDNIRLYILVDVLEDTSNDTFRSGDFFWLTFDVNKDSAITPNVDLNYGVVPGSDNMRYQYYLGPDTWTGLQPSTRSSEQIGFGCFIADGTLLPILSRATCSRHRVWEFGMDLAEIGARPGETVRMGLKIVSANPAFEDNIPNNFSADFSRLIEVTLAPLPFRPPTPTAGSVVGLASDALEVTQAIQTRANTMPLVADKSTVVRVYPNVSGALTSQPSIVYLYGSRGGADLPGSPLAFGFSAPPTVQRDDMNDTLNIPLPSSWDDPGTVRFTARVRDLNGNEASSTPIDLPFSARDVPLYWIVPVNFGTAAAPIVPSNADITEQESYLRAVYPAASVQFVRKDWTAIGATTEGQTISKLNTYFDNVVLAWIFGLIFTGNPPFDLPDQIYGFTPSGGGSSDPTWYSGRGYVARGFQGTSREGTMAHEINHNLDRSTDGTWGRHLPHDCGATGPDPSWPYPNDDIQEVGFDTRTPWVDGGGQQTAIPATWPDFMSYCQSGELPTKWISTYRWQALYNQLAAAAMRRLALRTNDVQTVYYISGEVRRDGTGSLNPVLVQPGIPTTGIAPGEYAIVLRDAQGGVLLNTPFGVSFVDVEGQPVDTVYFNFQLPAQQGTADIALTQGQTTLARVRVSAHAPTVRVTAPNGGESWEGVQSVQWTASDADQDELRFNILYSPDDGATWAPVAAQVTGTSFSVNTAFLAPSQAARMRVVATDGFNTVLDDSDEPFTVIRSTPTVTILRPRDYAALPPQTPTLFQGECSDPEVSEEALVWSYDGGTIFGLGRQVTAALPEGSHLVTLTLMGGQGAIASSDVRVWVGELQRIYLPLLTK